MGDEEVLLFGERDIRNLIFMALQEWTALIGIVYAEVYASVMMLSPATAS